MHIENISFLRKRLSLHLESFCLNVPDSFEGCFPLLQLSLAFEPTLKGLSIIEIGPVNVDGGNITLALPSHTSGSDTSVRAPLSLANPKIRALRLALKEITIQSDANRYSIKTIALKSLEGDPTLQLIVEGIDLGAPATHGDLNLTAKLKSNATLSYPLPYSLEASFHKGTQSLHLQSEGHLQEAQIEGTLTGKLHRPFNEMRSLQINKCHYKIPNLVNPVGSFDVSCSVQLQPNVAPLKHYLTLREYPLIFQLHTELDSNSGVSGTVSLELPSIKDPLLSINGKLTLEVSGNLTNFPSKISIDPNLEMNFDILNFQNVVSAFAQTQYPVPRPFNTLEGRVIGKVTTNKTEAHLIAFPITLRTALYSRRQKLHSSSHATLIIDKRDHTAFIDAEVALENVKLVLPELAILSLPPLALDPRFTNRPKADQTSIETPNSSFNYSLRVLSPKSNPLELISHLTKQTIPLYGDFTIVSDSSPRGSLHIKRVPLELFRRIAFIEDFTLWRNNTTNSFQVSSHIQIDYNLYTVFIEIVGDVETPKIILSSSPPMPRDKILSVLVFGKPLDQLDSEQATSISNLQGAMADGVIGLVSLYTLASTPIERMGYSPATKQFSAQVRIGDQGALILGSDFEHLHTLGLKRALGGNWWIQTYLNSDSNLEERSVTGFLEWIKRF